MDRLLQPPAVDTAMLGNWLRSWVQPSGAIHGFHNHSVWGGNPYRWNDFTSGHSAWSSLYAAGIACALQQRPDSRGLALLRALIGFQTGAFQENGQFAHIGFQVGESLKSGLIHNVLADVALALTAIHGRHFLSEADRAGIGQAIIRNLDACRVYGGGRATPDGCCNQEYARIWAKLLFRAAFDDPRWQDDIVPDLELMLERYHVAGLPDPDSEGTLRALSDPNTIEPAEYYGLMIAPLVLAYEQLGETRYLHKAAALCRHVARSAWTDANGNRRFHRLYYRLNDRFVKIDSPMLIAGMGDTLFGIRQYLRHERDGELAAFVADCEATFARHQTPRGYFTSASGWHSEIDIAPGTGWHAHDFHYWTARGPIPDDFWDRLFADNGRTSVLLGDQCFWIERGDHWSIADYESRDVYMLLGRKSQAVFGRDYPAWIGAPAERTLPAFFGFPELPVFVRTDRGIYLKAARTNPIDDGDIVSAASVPYLGQAL